MSIPGAASPLFLGAAVAEAAAFQIDRSVRLNSADSAYFSRTPSSASNRRTFTHSFWVKRSKLGSQKTIFSANTASNFNTGWQINFDSGDTLSVSGTSPALTLTTSQVFRDASAWYHILVSTDTTQATSSNRVKLYVNGTQVTSFGTSTYPSQNADLNCNGAFLHRISGLGYTSSVDFDGCLADVHFIDGQALAPTDFGEYDDNNNWNPKAYSGSYGTNGFHLLDFANESTIGSDSSGNNNDWTANNLQSSDGPIYSSGVTAYGGSLNSSHNVTSRLFDGGTGNSNRVVSSSTSGDGIKFVPSNAITGTIQLWLRNGDTANSTISYSLDNGSNFTNLTTTGGDGSYVSIGSQTISTTNGIIVRHITTAGTNAVDWRAISVNSAMLVDGNFGDVFRDTPTNADADSGNNIGNYATLNPLDSNIGSNLTNGNLDAAGSSNWSAGHARGTFGLTSGKWYWEVTRTGGSTTAQIGFCNKAFDLTTSYGSLPADSWTFAFGNGTEILRPSGGGANYFSGSAMGVGDTVGIALDMDNKTAVFYKNGTAGASISLSSTKTGSTNNIDELFPLVGVYNANVAFNGGQRPFAISSVPTGYKALCTQNLTDPTIADGSTAFDAVLYTGNQTARSITGLSFSPDLVIVKNRNRSGYNHYWVDTVRGSNSNLYSNSAEAEQIAARLSSLDSNGFSLTNHMGPNYSGDPYIAWAWDAGTSTATNTDGSITASVRANASAGFSICAYTGTGSNATFGHGLNAAPSLVIVKSRSDAHNWAVQHSALGPTYYLYLQSTNEARTTNSGPFWNSTAPTSSTVSVGTDNDTNASSKTYIAYCFAPVAGYSAFGSYSSGSDPFVYTGFAPRFVLLKKSSAAGHWYMFDSERGPINPNETWLEANGSGAEQTHANGAIRFLSNGFQPVGSDIDAASSTYVWAAFASHPFKTARAR